MCDAISIGLAAQGAGTLMKGQAQLAQGAAAKTAYNQSADSAERAAADAIERGEYRDLQVAMRGSAVIAEQRVAQSGTGGDVNSGGNLQTQLSTSAVTDVDRAVVRRDAALAAYGLRTRAQELRQQGEYAESEAESAALGTFLGGAGGLLSQGGKRFAEIPDPLKYSGSRSADSSSSGGSPPWVEV